MRLYEAPRLLVGCGLMKKGLEFKPHKMRPRDAIAHASHGTYTVSSDHTVKYTASDASASPKRLGKFGSRSEAVTHAQDHHASVGATSASKGFELMTIDACYDLLIKDQAGAARYHADAAQRKAPDPGRTAHVDRPPPATSDVSSRSQNERRAGKMPRKPKPTIQMKPISNDEAAAHLRSGTYSAAKQKSLRWLKALKALATGYGKVSGGGALKAANRGRSLQLLGPSGRAAGKSGGHYRKRSLSGKVSFGPDGRHGSRSKAAKFGPPKAAKFGPPKAAKFGKLRRAMEAMSAPAGSAKPPKVYLPGVHNPKSPVRAGTKKPTSTKAPTVPVVKAEHGITKGLPVANINYNDLFKSELGDDHLVDCPHCEAPITKADLAKAHKGKGKGAGVSGKRGKSSAHVSDHNGEGGAMRGGDGRGVLTPSRGVPGAQKTDAVVGVQNGKGSRTRKGGADSSIEEGEDDVDKSDDAGTDQEAAPPPQAPPTMKKSITVRGTDWVQYIDDGSDAALAKSIAEGTLGGTSPSRPLDLNNDLTRLLV
jgi:hypothetical protein